MPVVNRNGVVKSFSVIIAPENDTVMLLGMLSDIVIKPLVVARSFSDTISIWNDVLIGPAMFIKAPRMR